MAIEFSTPSFKPREYEGERISYTLYGLDSDGDELDDIITSPKKSTVIHIIKELLPDYSRIYNGMQVVAILYDENYNMLDSEVVWSTDQNESNAENAADTAWQVRVEFDLNGKREFTHVITHAGSEAEAEKNASAYVGREYDGSKNIAVTAAKALPRHKSEKLSYEKGHKNSKGEDAPWVIRSHKDGSVLASFPTKKEAENHMRTMKRYSKSEAANDIAAIQDRCDPQIVQKIIYAFTNEKASGWPYHPISDGGRRPRTRFVRYVGFWPNDYRFDDNGIPFSNKEMDAAVDKLQSSGYYIARSSYNRGYPAYFATKNVKDLRDSERVVTSIPHYEVPSSENKNEGTPANEARSVSYFILGKDIAERDAEKFVGILEDAVLKDQSVETTAEPDEAISVDIYGQLSPNEVERILQAASQLGIHISGLAVNI